MAPQVAANHYADPLLIRNRRGGQTATYLLVLVVNAISIRRRIASDREGLSFCCLAQLSIANLSAIGSRKVRTGSRPVAGRPGLFGVTFSLDAFAMFW